MQRIDRVLVLSLFAGYSLKLLVLGAQPADAAVVLVLAAAHFASAFYNHQKQINQLNQDNTEIKERIKAQDLVIGELRTATASIKMANMRITK